MKRSPVFAVSAFIACALLLPALPARAQLTALPQLGSPAPAALLNAKHQKECRTGDDHRDPCAEVAIDKVRYTIAWDAQSKDVTYVFTEDRKLVTDSGLSVGGTCRVFEDSGQPDATVPYMKWVIDPRWKGTDPSLSGSRVWYAALHKDGLDPHYGDIVGFVQSRYIQLKQ